MKCNDFTESPNMTVGRQLQQERILIMQAMLRLLTASAGIGGLAFIVLGTVTIAIGHESIIEALMTPWLAMCRIITPDEWQFRGNVLLALGWMISGLFIYGALLGTGGAVIALVAKRHLSDIKSEAQ